MSEPTWRDDLDSLLATAGEAQWVEEADERLTALLAERDSLALRLEAVAIAERNFDKAAITVYQFVRDVRAAIAVTTPVFLENT